MTRGGERIQAHGEATKAYLSLALRSRSLTVARRAKRIAADAETVPGWVAGAAAWEVAARSMRLHGDPTIVEVGVFMGRSTILLAAARRLRGSGKVYCVDAFDCSGDDYSVPFYRKELAAVGAASLEAAFRRNIAERELERWVEVVKGDAGSVAAEWNAGIDLLLLDGDHSPSGARAIFSLWSRFLKPGGQIILHNTGERTYAEGHDGNHRIATSDLRMSPFEQARDIPWSTYATKGRWPGVARLG